MAVVVMTLEDQTQRREMFPSVLMAEFFVAYALPRGYQIDGQRVVSARLVRLVQ